MTETDPVRLRRADWPDLPAIVRIYNQSIPERNATCDTDPVTLEERVPWFQAHTERYPLWVAERAGRVVGWACITPFGERYGYRLTVENSVYVDRDVRGNGLGRRLLLQTLDDARRLGYHAVVARVFAHNPASVALHRSAGFVEEGRLREVAELDGVFYDVLYLTLRFPDSARKGTSAGTGEEKR